MRFSDSFHGSGAPPVARPLVAQTPAPEMAVGRLRVVVVDDHEQMRRMLAQTLGAASGFEVVGEGRDGAEAVALVERLRPDLLLIDLAMPRMDGVEAIRRIRASGNRVPTLVLSSNGDHDSVTRAVEAGADGYVLKGAGASQIREALRDVAAGGAVLAPSVARGVVRDFVGLIEEKRRRDVAVIRTLASAVEKRDRVTGDHINNVATLSVELYREMTGAGPGEELVYGFLLHDVGKIGIPDAILQKDGPLEPDEVIRMRGHVDIGVDLIEPLGFGPSVTDVIRYHHERWDGGGYPLGLAGEAIPVHARLFSVVDAYDAMIADRPYRRGMTPPAAVDELRRVAGTQFDPACVAAFVSLAKRLSFI